MADTQPRSSKRSPGRMVLTLLGVVVAAYVGVAALLFLVQDPLIFPAPRVAKKELSAAAAHLGVTELDLVASDGTRLYGWHRPAGGDAVILYFGGNAETVASSQQLQALLASEGYDFVTVAPRGYPGSEGMPGEAGMTLDARAAWRAVTGDLGFPPDRVVLHGRSLGGGIIGTIIADEDVKPAGLVLESTFSSVLDVVNETWWMFPTRLLLMHPFLTRERAGAVTCPVLLVHGADDEVIGPENSRRLKPLFEDVRHLEVPGWGHNDGVLTGAPEAREAYRAFLKEVLDR